MSSTDNSASVTNSNLVVVKLWLFMFRHVAAVGNDAQHFINISQADLVHAVMDT